MLNLHFDPATSELSIFRNKTPAFGGASAATVSAMIISNDFEMQFSKLIIRDSAEITETGGFTILENSVVEVK